VGPVSFRGALPVFFLNRSQSVMRKLQKGLRGVLASSMSTTVSTGTWSVPGPWRFGLVLHEIIESVMLSVQKTLSTRVQFLVAIDCRVGVRFGSAMTRL
jgi:hypothetical protein